MSRLKRRVPFESLKREITPPISNPYELTFLCVACNQSQALLLAMKAERCSDLKHFKENINILAIDFFLDLGYNRFIYCE